MLCIRHYNRKCSLRNVGPFQTSLLSCAKPNVNEQNPLFDSFALGAAHEKSDV